MYVSAKSVKIWCIMAVYDVCLYKVSILAVYDILGCKICNILLNNEIWGTLVIFFCNIEVTAESV